jgi:hypothetical protein
MSVHLTDDPAAERGLGTEAVLGKPVHLPAVLLCQAAPPGQRPCGRVWTANTERQFVEKAAERREHERTCNGGLIVATGIGDVR